MKTPPDRTPPSGAARAPASALPALLLIACAACGSPATSPWPEFAPPPPPERPASCIDVPAGGLQAFLDDPASGDSFCLRDGIHPGPVRVGRSATIWGSRAAVIASSGEGTTVHASAPGARLLGFTVDGSGGRFDLQDAAVHVTADDVVVEGVAVRNAVFGILVERCHRPVLRGNDVEGLGRGPFGLRGDGIRLWETRDGVIERNRVTGGRDVVVWYSSGNRIAGNMVRHGRYGAHLMYSHDNVVEGNMFLDDVVGVFVMYSRNVVLHRNLLARSRGSAGMGLGVKESGNLEVTENSIVDDTIGVYLDASPVQVTESNLFRGNAVIGCETGVLFHRSEVRNAFLGNLLHDNRIQVRVDGGGDALGVKWEGNDFDDYRGWDFDGDGTGDLPHELISLSGRLQDTHPDLAFLSGSPSLAMVDAASRLLPLIAPKPVLVDASPRVGPRPSQAPHEAGGAP